MNNYDAKLKFKLVNIIPMPQCLEGNTFNIHNNKLYVSCGFCGGFEGWGNRVGAKVHEKIDSRVSYKRGFFNKLFIHDLSNNDATWHQYDLPIAPRQNLDSIIINNRLIILGGYSYSPLSSEELSYYNNNNIKLPSKSEIFTKNDGVLINLNKNNVVNPIYCKKINIHQPLTEHNIIKDPDTNSIYILNGTVYDNNAFKTPLKMHMMKYTIDSSDNLIIDDTIKFTEFPGTYRFSSNCFIKDGFIHVIGGCTGTDMLSQDKGYAENELANVLDNWKYDIKKDKWTRLRDFPFAMCYQKGTIFKDKYYILIGGVSYKKTIILKKKYSSSQFLSGEQLDKFPYNGIASIKNNDYKVDYQDYKSYANQHSNMIVVYDIENDKYSISNSTLPINISAAPVKIDKDYIYIAGGEASVNTIPLFHSSGSFTNEEKGRCRKEDEWTANFYGINLGCILKIKITDLN